MGTISSYLVHPIFLGLVPRNFEFFIFEPKLSFSRKNHKNPKSGEFLDFYEFTLYTSFAAKLSPFPEIGHSDNGYFSEKS